MFPILFANYMTPYFHTNPHKPYTGKKLVSFKTTRKINWMIYKVHMEAEVRQYSVIFFFDFFINSPYTEMLSISINLTIKTVPSSNTGCFIGEKKISELLSNPTQTLPYLQISGHNNIMINQYTNNSHRMNNAENNKLFCSHL